MEARFWSKVRKTKTCWVWIGSISRYGYFRVGNKKQGAHRWSWYLKYGQLPKLSVLHRCDNPICVRPDHLFLGSHLDNMKDMASKGRSKNRNVDKKLCDHGHEFTLVNTYVRKDNGARQCKMCRDERKKKFKEQSQWNIHSA